MNRRLQRWGCVTVLEQRASVESSRVPVADLYRGIHYCLEQTLLTIFGGSGVVAWRTIELALFTVCPGDVLVSLCVGAPGVPGHRTLGVRCDGVGAHGE